MHPPYPAGESFHKPAAVHVRQIRAQQTSPAKSRPVTG